jgi:hypothetical protein
MELINISQQILSNIKKIIDRDVNNDKKAVGFSQLTQWYATGKMTKGQMQKIISFYDNYSTGDAKDLERKNIYDELHLLPWCKSQTDHLKRVQKTLRKVYQYTGTNRTVDRLIKPSSASVRPQKILSIKDMLREGLVQYEQQKQKL